MIKLEITPDEYAWLERLAVQEAVDHETGQIVTHPFASDIIVRSKLRRQRRALSGWLTKPSWVPRRVWYN